MYFKVIEEMCTCSSSPMEGTFCKTPTPLEILIKLHAQIFKFFGLTETPALHPQEIHNKNYA